MKINLAPYLASLLFVFAVASSCKTQDVNQTVYKTSKGSHITAEYALGAWNAYIKEHPQSVETELKVQAAYDKYRATQHSLLTFAINNATNSVISTNQFDVVITQTSAALSELINLLSNLGVKF